MLWLWWWLCWCCAVTGSVLQVEGDVCHSCDRSHREANGAVCIHDESGDCPRRPKDASAVVSDACRGPRLEQEPSVYDNVITPFHTIGQLASRMPCAVLCDGPLWKLCTSIALPARVPPTLCSAVV